MFNYPNSNPYLNNYTQQTQTPYPATQLFFVNGIKGVHDYIVPLNSTIYFKDSDSDKIFVKSCDNMGRTYLKAYKLSEINENEPIEVKNVENYVKMSDFKALETKFDELQQIINDITKSEGVEQK